MKNTILILTLFASQTSFAGDVSETKFLGFSADFLVAGFMQSGTQDGSGFPYCTVTLIDTAKNSFYVPQSLIVLEDEKPGNNKALACANAKAKIQKTLTTLKLNPDLGTHVFSRKITEVGGAGAKSIQFGTYSIFPQRLDHTVTITTSDSDIVNPLTEGKSQLLSISLTSNDGHPKILQADKKLPDSRKYVYDYELADGYVAETPKKSVKVFSVRTYATGFEGPDVRTMYISNVETY